MTPNLLATLEWIESHPLHWDQSTWHCGTSHCFAGVGQMLMRSLDPEKEFPEATATGPSFQERHDLMRWWGIIPTTEAWLALTYHANTLADLRRLIRDPQPYGSLQLSTGVDDVWY